MSLRFIRFHVLVIATFMLSATLAGQTLFVPSGTSGVGSSSTTNVGVGASAPPYHLYVNGDVGVSADRHFIARYTANESYRATFGWSHLQLGNNGQNWIVAGRTSSGGALSFVVNNTNDYTYAGYNGNLAMHITAGGMVGVGTTSPDGRLHASASPNTYALRTSGGNLETYLYHGAGAGIWYANASGGFTINNQSGWLALSGNNAEAMRIISDGYVGIGTTNPTRLLSINGPANAYMGFKVADVLQSTVGSDSNGDFFIFDDQTATYRMVVNTVGNVGIGTTNPTQKLSVNGTIRAKEVIVEASPWPDDVFEEGYKLKALSEVAAHIEAEGHLPGVPSAAIVAEQGVAVGEMQRTVMRKIEELTLYIIAQDKRIYELEQKLAAGTGTATAP